MKAGDTATLIGIPPNVRDEEEFKTRTLFERCLGKSFVIAASESFEGVPFPLARIEIARNLGDEFRSHTIWVELEYLQMQKPESCVAKRKRR